MTKPLFWLGPVLLAYGDWYDLFNMRHRQPVYDLTAEHVIQLKFQHDINGVIAIGLFPSVRSRRLMGSRITENVPDKLYAKEGLVLNYRPIMDITLPNNIVVTGEGLKRMMAQGVQEAMAAEMRRHIACVVRPGSELLQLPGESSHG